MNPDRCFAELAASQLGCATMDQAHECGLSSDQLRHRLRSGRFERFGVRVLRVAGAPPSWEQSLLAGVLDLGPDAVVSHRAAAALYGLEGFPSGPVEFTVPRSRRGIETPWTVHTTLTLPLRDRAHVGRFPCTTATRTVIDLARRCTVAELERAIDSAVRGGHSSPWFLRRRLDELRGSGRAGVRLLDDALRDSGGHSQLERMFLGFVRRLGLPKPACQRIFRADGRTVARVDFSFEPRPVVVEVSGRLGHSTDRERAIDARRRNELQAAGLIVLEFTFDDLSRRPAYVASVLRRHLA